ncbi:MAG: spore cortex-lytic enzyme [Clostridia bacterium]|nr:spore cortex-lytic enzyme [Clostridia bacterium]
MQIQKNINSTATKMLLVLLALVLLAGLMAYFLPLDNGVADAAVLKQGSTGATVKTMQTKLINWGYLSGKADGIFGAKTKAAVIKFQRNNGLTADGVVGTKTAQAMGLKLTGSTTTTPSSGSGTSSSTDLNLLARAIYGEARGEPYTGQVAVAAVILNRVKSSSFPNTIAGVIYQAGAFDCVADGQINLTPNQNAYNAARDALNGWDPTYGCLFYYNPRTATSKWMLSRTVKLNIGNHAFC